MKYYTDYPTEPIGGGNPYYCCIYCGESDPHINGRLEGHRRGCEYVQQVKAKLLQDDIKAFLDIVKDKLPTEESELAYELLNRLYQQDHE